VGERGEEELHQIKPHSKKNFKNTRSMRANQENILFEKQGMGEKEKGYKGHNRILVDENTLARERCVTRS